MFGTKILYRILQVLLIYLLLRYTPFIKLSFTRAIAVTFILTAFILTFEAIYNYVYLAMPSTKDNCDICTIPKPQNTCRMVCDTTEHFTQPPAQHTSAPAAAQPSAQPSAQPAAPAKPKQDDYVTNVNKLNIGFGGMFYDDYVGSSNTGTYLADPEYEKKREMNEKIATKTFDKEMENRATSTSGYNTPYQEPGALSETRKPIDHNRRIEGELDNDLPYSDFNHLPVAAGYKSHDYEYGYSYLPPEKWFPINPRPPICITDHKATVYPVLANGTPVDVKEFHSSTRLTQPDRISTSYTSDKLNAGR